MVEVRKDEEWYRFVPLRTCRSGPLPYIRLPHVDSMAWKLMHDGEVNIHALIIKPAFSNSGKDSTQENKNVTLNDAVAIEPYTQHSPLSPPLFYMP